MNAITFPTASGHKKIRTTNQRSRKRRTMKLASIFSLFLPFVLAGFSTAAADLAQDALEPEATAIFEDHGESSPENGLRRRLQCLKTDEWCTGPGVGDKKCCSGLECRLKPGSDADGPKQCLSPPRPPTCLKTGEWCTGPGVGSKKCCSGLICRLKAGDDLDGPKQCLRCVKRNQRCYRNVDCCGAMKCRTSGQIKKCS